MPSSQQMISFGTSCATDFEMEARLSPSFRANVYLNNSAMALTVLMTVLAVRKMMNRELLGKVTRSLFFFCMFYYFIHDVYFAWTLNSSLHRSISQSGNSCKIMFNGEECYFLYIFGVFLRLLLLYSQFAIAIERTMTAIFPDSEWINSATLNTLTFLVSVSTTALLRPDEPSVYNSPNCFQQSFVGMPTLRHLIWITAAVTIICFPLNCAVTLWYRKKFRTFRSTNGYDLQSRCLYKNNMYSALIVSIISFVQTIFYAIYIIGVSIVFHLYSDKDGIFYGNDYALWFYTYPLAGLALPCSILLSFTVVGIKKNNKIAVLQSTTASYTQEAYFKSLTTAWDAKK